VELLSFSNACSLLFECFHFIPSQVPHTRDGEVETRALLLEHRDSFAYGIEYAIGRRFINNISNDCAIVMKNLMIRANRAPQAITRRPDVPISAGDGEAAGKTTITSQIEIPRGSSKSSVKVMICGPPPQVATSTYVVPVSPGIVPKNIAFHSVL
jgi:hypothetical protein